MTDSVDMAIVSGKFQSRDKGRVNTAHPCDEFSLAIKRYCVKLSLIGTLIKEVINLFPLFVPLFAPPFWVEPGIKWTEPLGLRYIDSEVKLHLDDAVDLKLVIDDLTIA